MLAGVVLNLALIGLALVRHPNILGSERVPFVIVDVAVLLGYAAVAVGMSSFAEPVLLRALVPATLVGLAGGLLQGAEIAREDLIDLERTIALLSGLLGMLALFVLFGLAGWLARQGQVGGAVSGAWCAMFAMLVLWLVAWGLDYAFADRLARIWPGDYDYTHGNTLMDLHAYTLWNTLSAAFSHALLLPCFGALFGWLGGVLGERRASRHAADRV